MGTGYRATVERLSVAERATVREANLAFIRDHEIVRLPTNALYAVATKKNDFAAGETATSFSAGRGAGSSSG